MSTWEQYTYPGSDVLRNKADLRNQADLDRFERGVTAIRLQSLREQPVQGDYGLKHLQDIHRKVFGDVYDWAGDVRAVDIAKGPPNDRTLFALREDIPIKAELLQATIEGANFLRGLDRKEFGAKMGEIYAVLNDIHPFREGNGRASREFMLQLAKESGHDLDYTRVVKHNWNEAAKQSARGNLEPIKEVFYRLTVVERAVAFDMAEGRDGQREALGKHPELDTAFKRLHQVQQAGGDVGLAKAELSRVLHEGHLPTANVTKDESSRVIANAAAHRGLMVRDAEQLGGLYRGEVVAMSAHHALLRVGDLVAVRYERANLDRDLQVGERVEISFSRDQSKVHQPGQAPAIHRGHEAMPMEREYGY